MVALLNWLREQWAKRDPLYCSDAEAEAAWQRIRERKDRENKRRKELESDAEFMEMLKRVAHGSLGAAGDASFMMCGPVRILQIPIPDKGCIPHAWTGKPTPEHKLPTFHGENIELRRLPTWFMGKFYDLYAGYGPESKLVAWRLGNRQAIA